MLVGCCNTFNILTHIVSNTLQIPRIFTVYVKINTQGKNSVMVMGMYSLVGMYLRVFPWEIQVRIWTGTLCHKMHHGNLVLVIEKLLIERRLALLRHASTGKSYLAALLGHAG